MPDALKKISWAKWKLGMFVAILTGAATAMVAFGAADEMHWKGVVTLFVACVGKDLVLYLQQHPVDSISDSSGNTEILTKKDISNETNTPPPAS